MYQSELRQGQLIWEKQKYMKYGSLFAGVGGFDIGLENAGWQCAWQVEWDPHCQQTLAHHWPNVPRWGDVSDVDGAELPPVDVITFGSPCQDLSVAGKRAGLIEGGRSNLFFQATRIIREMKEKTNGQYPRIAIWENVPGALSSNNGDDFEAVLGEMADLGSYHLEWSVLDAQFFGVPQRRRRVFVIAVLDPTIAPKCTPKILAIGEGRPRNRQTGKGNIVAFYRTHGHNDKWQTDVTPPVKQISPVAIASESQQPRLLTPIETERLMGWPDNHTLHRADGKTNSDTTRYKMCGNGVASPVAQWIAESINNIL
jgi:site-specific DNA-cytosine methylase